MKILIRTLLVAGVLAIGWSVATAGNTNPLATPPEGRKFLPSPVIFPDQQIPLRFFHDKHLAQDVECTDCHDSATTSLSSADILVPTGHEAEENVCSNCHDFSEGLKADPPSGCTTCHTNEYLPDFPPGADVSDSTKARNKIKPMIFPAPNIKMNHKVHIDRGIKCSRCHGEMTNIQVATRENALPVMNTCLECHDGRQAPSECRTCHVTKPDGRLVNHFASGVLKPQGRYENDAHDDNYLKTHAQTAKRNQDYCNNCHEQKFCLDCHNGVAKPFKIHPNNWAVLHPLAARRNTPSCSSCHRSQNFCIDCHKRTGVVRASEFGSGKSNQAWNKTKLGSFHPAGWVGAVAKGSARGANHHSFQAQRNIRTCAACHTEKTCLECHKSDAFAGVGITPHPPNYKTSARCRAQRASNTRMCAKCHGPVVPKCQ
ncbi:MAG: hypothetical protein ACI9OJ_001698 [Myxococcota bacterium]|jgi:hypothetical protein